MRPRLLRLIGACIVVLALAGCVRYKAASIQAPRSKNPHHSSSPAGLSQYIRTVLRVSQENTVAAGDALKQLHERRPELAELSRRLADQPADLETLRSLAGTYLTEGLYFSAFQLYQEIRTRAPDDPAAELAMARIWDAWGEYSLARQCVEHALLLDPESAETLEEAGRIHLHRKEIDAAISSFLAALSIAPENALLQANLGYAYLLRGDWENSRRSLERAVSTDGSIAEAHNNLGIVLAHLGDREGAFRQFMMANSRAATFNNLGVVYLAQNRWEQARNEFRHALSLEPDYSKASLNLLEAEAHVPPPPVESPVSLKIPTPIPQRADPVAFSQGLFKMQVYSTRSESMASERAKILAETGYQTRLVRRDMKKKGVWFGVRLEGFDSRKAAREAAEKLLAKGIITEYWIVGGVTLSDELPTVFRVLQITNDWWIS